MIYRTLRVLGTKGSKSVNALFDSGASTSAIQEHLASSIGRPIDLPFPRLAETATQQIKIRQAIQTMVRINGYSIDWFFFLVPGLTEQLVIGQDFLDRFNVSLDFRRKKVTLDRRYLKMKLMALKTGGKS